MRESKIEEHLVKRVKALGGEVRKVKWIGRVSAPDRFVMLPEEVEVIHPGNHLVRHNVSFWVELKATGKKATAAQEREHKRMRDLGQRVLVIDSIEGVERILK